MTRQMDTAYGIKRIESKNESGYYSEDFRHDFNLI